MAVNYFKTHYMITGMETASSFLHLVFVGFVALFPPVNPVGTALILGPYLNRLNSQERKTASAKIALYSFLICAGTLLIGSWIFKLFGISLPVVQVAGGILICQMGFQLLSADNQTNTSKESSAPETHHENIEDSLFYPMAFPMTTGAGTISVLLTLSAHGHDNNFSQHLINLSALFLAVLFMCLMVYICYAFTPALLGRLGARGELIINRLSAFLVFCVGIQIASVGLTSLIKG